MNETATADLLERIQRGSSNLTILIGKAVDADEKLRLTTKRDVVDTCAKMLRNTAPTGGINGLRAYLNMIEKGPMPAPGERDGASLVRDYLRSYEGEL